jgi:hypothetical protein
MSPVGLVAETFVPRRDPASCDRWGGVEEVDLAVAAEHGAGNEEQADVVHEAGIHDRNERFADYSKAELEQSSRAILFHLYHFGTSSSGRNSSVGCRVGGRARPTSAFMRGQPRLMFAADRWRFMFL